MESLIYFPKVYIKYRNFSLTISPITLKAGEILGIFGKSGAGKTSYLKKLREFFPSSDVYYMSQSDCLLEGITVRQNIELGLACANKPKNFFNHWEKTYSNLLKEFEVDRQLDKYPKALSGGQRKRVEIARTLIMNPKILLLDEPFTGIGHLFEAVATKYLILRSESKTGAAICVSHDFNLLSKFSSQILLIDEAGVIETIPIGSEKWEPNSIRTANTLGLENIITVDEAEVLSDQKLNLEKHASLGFWQNAAHWHEDSNSHPSDPLHLFIDSSKIVNKRSYFTEGKIYTRIQLETKPKNPPLVLVGEGEIKDNPKNLYLGVRQFSYLN